MRAQPSRLIERCHVDGALVTSAWLKSPRRTHPDTCLAAVVASTDSAVVTHELVLYTHLSKLAAGEDSAVPPCARDAVDGQSDLNESVASAIACGGLRCARR